MEHYMRTDWVKERQNDEIRTQMHYARAGQITGEMKRVAEREKLDPELVRSELRAGPDGDSRRTSTT